MSGATGNLANSSRRPPSRWPGRACGLLLGCGLAGLSLVLLTRHQRHEREEWRLAEAEERKAVSRLIDPGQVAESGGDLVRALAAGKTLARRADSLAVKERLDRGLPREGLRQKLDREADLDLAAQQKQLIRLEAVIAWLRGLTPGPDRVAANDPLPWTDPAKPPAPHLKLVPVAAALQVPLKAREVAAASPAAARLAAEGAGQEKAAADVQMRISALAVLLKHQAFNDTLPGLGTTLAAHLEGVDPPKNLGELAQGQLKDRERDRLAAGKALEHLQALGGPEDDRAGHLEEHIRRRVDLVRVLFVGYQAGDAALVDSLRKNPRFRQVVAFAKAVDGGTGYVRVVQESGLPKARREALNDLLFEAEKPAHWLVKWYSNGAMPPVAAP